MNLSEEQAAVVHAIWGPVLVTAGAGAGKTMTMAARTAHILESGQSPHGILMVTFTNKAARELADRVHKFTGIWLPWVGTFHSIAARLIRPRAPALGLTKRFCILDETDALGLYRNLCRQRGLTEDLVGTEDGKSQRRLETSLIDEAFEVMQCALDRGLDRDQCLDTLRQSEIRILLERSYIAYQHELIAHDALDFPGLLLGAREILRRCPDIAQEFEFVVVDEYQDTSKLQDEIVGLIGGYHRNVCVVGDEKQSIYGWRGAEVSNLRRFPSNWSGCQVLRLSDNYRSVPSVCVAASKLMQNARDLRFDARLNSMRPPGAAVVGYVAETADSEADRIARKISRLVSEGMPRSEIAILYRIHLAAIPVEKALLSWGVPYQLVGGTGFLQRAAAKDLIAYLRLSMRPQDDLAFLRVVNVPARGIGAAAIQLLQDSATSAGTSLWSAPTPTGLKPKQLRAFYEWCGLIKSIQGKTVRQVLDAVMDLAGLGTEDKPEYAAAAEELARLGQEHETVDELLEHLALGAGQDTDQDRVCLSSMHAAKGREWRIVFAIGWEDSTFPWPKSDIEEERRLAYVTLTRAKDELYVGYPRTRFLSDGIRRPSPFLREAGIQVGPLVTLRAPDR